MSTSDFESVQQAFDDGGLIAYPTEAVMGLGCDPDNLHALEKLLALKNRAPEKGLILVAANYAQLLPYVEDELIPQDRRFAIFSRWPGPVTWLLPKKANVPLLLSGDSDKIAVRVPAMQSVRDLCLELNKPIVSTSANLAGQPPAIAQQQLDTELVKGIDWIVPGEVGGNAQPSQIFDCVTGQQIR